MVRLVVALASISLFTSAAADSTSFPDFKVERAREYLETVAKAVQSQCTANAHGCFVLARLRSQLGEKDQAEQLARRALELDPNRAEVQSFLADILILQDRMPEAAGLLRRALELNPDIPGGERRLGMALDRLGDRAGARKAFEAALGHTPKDATLQFLLGQLLLDQGQLKQAETHLRSACELDPKLASALYLLAQAQTRLGDADGARESLKSFQELKRKEKNDLDAKVTGYDDGKFMRTLAVHFHTDLGELCIRQKQVSQAEAHLRQAIALGPNEAAAYELLARLLLQAQRLAEAKTVCQSLVSLQPDQASYRVNLGTLLLQLKEYSAALKELKHALELDPKQPEALNNLARFYLGSRQDVPEALALARRLIECQPSAANFDLLGWALYSNGQTNLARAAAALAVEHDPTNTVYRERYQRLLKAQ